MATYVVSGTRFDDAGEVSHVRWARVDGSRNQFEEPEHLVDVDRVIRALDHGDVVEMRFQIATGWVSGGRLLRKVLPSGHERVVEERGDPGRTLQDLPHI